MGCSPSAALNAVPLVAMVSGRVPMAGTCSFCTSHTSLDIPAGSLEVPLLLLPEGVCCLLLISPGEREDRATTTLGTLASGLALNAAQKPRALVHWPLPCCAIPPLLSVNELHAHFRSLLSCFSTVAAGPSGTYSSNSPASPLSSASLTSPLSPFSLVSGSQGSPTKQGASEVSGAAVAWG